MDIMTTSPHRTDDTGRQLLAQQLASAWSAARPWTDPPAQWLTAAVTALAAAVTQHDAGEPERIDASDMAGSQDIAGQLRQLHGETRHHANAAATRRRQLAGLQAQVRERAIDQLYSSPELEDALRDALAEWGLPPIEGDSGSEDEDSDI